MKIMFDIDSTDDAANAAAMCIAIIDALELYGNPERLREKLDEREKVKAAHGSGGNSQLPPEEPVATPVKEARGRKKKTTISNPHDAGTTNVDGNYTPAAGRDTEEARDQLRVLAKKNGVVWMRELLATHGAERLGDLTDSQVAHALAQ
jgi:hypothetical protein